MNIAGHDIGVCSWSLAPKGTQDLIARVGELGLQHVQLALGPLAQLDDKRKHQELGLLRDSGLTFTAGMINYPDEDYTTIASIRKTGGFVSDKAFPLRRQLAKAAGQLAVEMGITQISAHVGFIPPSSDPNYDRMAERLGEVASDFKSLGLTLLMETGQETAPELLQFLNDLSVNNVKVNFDPANMILYGAGDPIEAIGVLGRHIGHVHVKDATLSDTPGAAWGTEVPFGAGQVPPREFLRALADAGYTGPLVIEREAGARRMEDIRQAIQTLETAATPPAA
ncbi:MAG TPA: sugar phosphate isomerase/epimerase family protein [Tepidisphaeraceae bacterium]|nr:sugar phosphate isomerase/epimerase family protein [Tepidisphaeraceae bacterium]